LRGKFGKGEKVKRNIKEEERPKEKTNLRRGKYMQKWLKKRPRGRKGSKYAY
jgi:hypothetical protein